MNLITIDGPSASGKGTVSQRVATILGWNVLDSGALYRLSALTCIRNNVPISNIDLVVKSIKEMDIRFCDGEVFLDSNIVTEDIRNEEVGLIASKLASIPEVRLALVDLQHSFLTSKGLIADGRDMGTVIFPEAPLKIFLDSDLHTRVTRRFNQLKEKGIDANYDEIWSDMARRDELDRNRKISPLIPSADALIIDSTHLSIDEVVNLIITKWQNLQSTT
ncbi:(d)CMP kinase [Taylorella equigenitalis]|uniref:Cytidylate kinase n=3 Tax=Taylorella equigenitalis TaxID=29575 RepID=A0A654KI61_TAYEM|nr:(d)CMP kinase [Taylorella equigenitalis]ADU92085.1 Cytidylate kinase [Taylorella equigenitalis MCE9]AFN35646.1 cytidylate kinase [Taylorella equigenitalis ATCC 35865]ASY30296.1 cytidylate kinase [Taylorella equigenitalis]ASY37599.1 (d)CMP kinase [Taylorella equigenitalis]ASY39068.1 cytidylate kinase [Taylorella equigenitalis]